MDVADFDYSLPADRIAQHPAAERDAAKLLVDMGPDQPPADRLVRDLPDLLEPGDLLVANRTLALTPGRHATVTTSNVNEFAEVNPAESFGYRNVKVPGYEADVVIASLAERAREAGQRVIVVTGDRDAF